MISPDRKEKMILDFIQQSRFNLELDIIRGYGSAESLI